MKYLLTLFLLFSFSAFANKIMVANFSSGDLSDWQEKEFKNLTLYKIVTNGDNKVLQAKANNSASGLFIEQAINLKKTPYLNWRWKISNHLNTKNERTKKSDDYSARIYVIISGGIFFWKTKTLNYVWSNNMVKNTLWANAFAPNNTMMLAVKSNKDKLNTWYVEKRNVLEDLKTAFKDNFNKIDAIAIMSDTDNTGGKSEAYFGNIYFSSE